MKAIIITRGIAITMLALAGCTKAQNLDNRGAQRGAQTNSSQDLDAPANRRMITGSNVPQPVNRPTFSRTSADTPLESAARDRPGLVPTEPIVGAGGQSDYRASEPSTGAGPAGSNPYPGN